MYHSLSPDLPQTSVTSVCKIGMFLLPGFNSMAANAFIDPFRAANYLRGHSLYEWQYVGINDQSVVASNGSTVNCLSISDVKPNFTFSVVNASWTPEKFCSRKVKNWLRANAHAGATLVGIDTGAFIIAKAGLLENYKAAVHYEHIAAFKELFPDSIVDEILYVIDRDRLSCAGGMTACDLALEIIRMQQGIDLANAAAHYIFHDRLRTGDEKQQSPNYEPVGYTIPVVLRDAIILMERNLEEPLRLTEIAHYLKISQRQLERMFIKHTGMTPVRYYINIRLDRARGLVTQTDLSIAEISNACGFGSPQQFTRVYKHRFSILPSKDRTEGRIPFQFRSFPGYAGI